MLRVMLVDDKKSILEGLEILIDWESVGYKIVATATSGAQAIKTVQEQSIDLIITDIRMPRVSGLELVEQIKEISAHTKFILLTGYSEFEYAKWAIDYQISGYLLKPVDENELTALLNRIKSEFDKQKEYTNQYIIKCMIGALAGDKSYAEELLAYHSSDHLRYVVIKPFYKDMLVSDIKSYSREQVEKVVEVLKSSAEYKDDFYMIEGTDGDIELVVDFNQCKCDVLDYVSKLEHLFMNRKIWDFVIFVGEKVKSIVDIHLSKESVKILESALFYDSSERILLYDDYKDVTYTAYFADKEVIDHIITSIYSLEKKQLEIAIDKFHENIVDLRVRPEIVLSNINKIIFDAANHIHENGGEVVKFMYRWSQLKKTPNLTHIIVCVFLSEITSDIQSMLAKIKKGKTRGIVGDVVEYINTNYSNENLNLQWVAKKHYITPAYLGKIFKEKKGVTFKSYLTEIRIEKAKELLKNSDHKIYKIANMVGFVDSNYFYVKFQEFENITPAKYRELNQ